MLLPAISGKSLQILGSKCLELRSLDLSYVALISDISLRSIVRCCKVPALCCKRMRVSCGKDALLCNQYAPLE